MSFNAYACVAKSLHRSPSNEMVSKNIWHWARVNISVCVDNWAKKKVPFVKKSVYLLLRGKEWSIFHVRRPVRLAFNITTHQRMVWQIFHQGTEHFASIFNMHIIAQHSGHNEAEEDFLVFIGVQLQWPCTDVITRGMSGELFSGQQWICQSWWGSAQETALRNKSNTQSTSTLCCWNCIDTKEPETKEV